MHKKTEAEQDLPAELAYPAFLLEPDEYEKCPVDSAIKQNASTTIGSEIFTKDAYSMAKPALARIKNDSVLTTLSGSGGKTQPLIICND